jgi:hypothetical protein
MQATRWTQGGDEHDGSDIDAYAALWFAAMDRWVLRDGEEIVCPQIFTTCFESASDDALKTWYLGMPSVVRTIITTKPGCWDRFKNFLFMRFLIGDGLRLRQLAAEEVRAHRPGVPCATFAIWKIYYMQCDDPHLAPWAAIATVKRALGREAAAFCRERENIDDFISELTEFDEQHREQQAHPPCGEKPLCWNLEVSNDSVACHGTMKKSDEEPEQPDESIRTTSDGVLNAESIMTTTDAEMHAEKHQEKSTTGKPEQPDEIIMPNTDGELNGERIGTTKDGEFKAEKHDEGIHMKNAPPFNAQRHPRLTARSKASCALDARQLKKEVIRASTLWFASDRCCEDELRDGIG